MNFEIPVETYIRLAQVSNFIRKEFVSDEERALLKCVRLENSNGKAYAIASNRKIGAIYYLGAATENGAVHINVDDALLQQCEKEKMFNSKIHVVAIPDLGMVSIKTTLGFSMAGNIGFFSSATPLQRWREWVPPEPVKKTKGAMHWVTHDIEALNAASPSGRINFPEFVDATQPVILRDDKFENWLGVFMPNCIDEKGKVYAVEPATLPTWWNE